MSEHLTEAVEGIVTGPIQTEATGLDLTLGTVSDISGAGRVDFGGGEHQLADRMPVATILRNRHASLHQGARF